MTKRVLLTGANGFLGTHILKELLHSNISVLAIVRSQSKASLVRSAHPQQENQKPLLDIGIVSDITAPGAFNAIIQSTADSPIDVVIHTASPFLYKAVTNNLTDFLIPAKQGTEEILRAVKLYGKGVKRVVVTSSCAAVLDFAKGDNGRVYTAEDWNPSTWEEAREGDKGVGYRGSKKFAELAAWDFMKQEKPAFDLVTLCPPMIYGPPAHHIASPADLNESNARIYNLFINSSRTAELPPNGLYLYVDVRDIAHAHLLAATVPTASNKRFIISGGRIGSQYISEMLRLHIPELEDRTPEGKPGVDSLPKNAYSADSGPAEMILGMRWRGAEETFVELGRGLLEIERGSM